MTPEKILSTKKKMKSFAQKSNRLLKKRFGTNRVRKKVLSKFPKFSGGAFWLSWIICAGLAVLLTPFLVPFLKIFPKYIPFLPYTVYFAAVASIIFVPLFYFPLANRFFFFKYKFGFLQMVGYDQKDEFPYEFITSGPGLGTNGSSFSYMSFKGIGRSLDIGDIAAWIYTKKDKSSRAFIFLNSHGKSSIQSFVNDQFKPDFLKSTNPPLLTQAAEFSELVEVYHQNSQSIASGLQLTAKKANVQAKAIAAPRANPLTSVLTQVGEATGVIKTSDPFEELNSQIGLQLVKDQVMEIYKNLQMDKKRQAADVKVQNQTRHFVFTGNPGTGKTTIARILGRLFKEIGLLKTGEFVEVDRQKLVSNYRSQTAIQTEEWIQKAMGGILFIDEAPTLVKKDDNGDFGQEAVDHLMKRMEDARGEFIVIAAGYKKEMKDFIASNPGLPSRFKYEIEFPDYTSSELAQIFQKYVGDANLKLEEGWQKAFEEIAQDALRKQTAKDPFPNARWVRNLFEKTVDAQGSRLEHSAKKTEVQTLTLADINRAGGVTTVSEEDRIDPFKELDEQIGLQEVKDRVHSIAGEIEAQKVRAADGVDHRGFDGHFVFTGNPGTGKTTVARILAKILKDLGVLPKGNYVEVDQGKLIGQYVGSTAKQTTEKIDEAMGGVLFIDEAYGLVGHKTSGGGDFGAEAITTLLKRMEDDRGKFVVIAAGYKDQMDLFLKSNPGLPSRFKYIINFPDYNADDCSKIFMGMARKGKFKPEERMESLAKEYFTLLIDNWDHNQEAFSNAREVRRRFDSVVEAQGKRIVREKSKDGATLLLEDFRNAFGLN